MLDKFLLFNYLIYVTFISEVCLFLKFRCFLIKEHSSASAFFHFPLATELGETHQLQTQFLKLCQVLKDTNNLCASLRTDYCSESVWVLRDAQESCQSPWDSTVSSVIGGELKFFASSHTLSPPKMCGSGFGAFWDHLFPHLFCNLGSRRIGKKPENVKNYENQRLPKK